MRILVHGTSTGSHSRLALAAYGLALRGHEVFWWGGRPPEPATAGPRPLPGCLVLLPGGRAAARIQAEIALAGPTMPLRAAVAAWLARAHGLVLSLDARTLRRWGWRARWAWDSLRASGLVEPSEAEELRRDPPPVPLDRLALWSDEPPPDGPRAEHLDTEILERACERALARHRSSGPRAGVFVDRDGTLVIERGYLSDPADLELLPGVPEAIRTLRATGLAVVVISNQSGVGRGFFPLSRVYEAMAALRHALRAHGAELDAIYFCPHRPEAGCACRKPGTGLLERAADDLQLSLDRSVFVGDKLLDVETGHNAGARGVLVRTGYGRGEEERLASSPGSRPPDHVSRDLAEAAEWILGAADLDRPA